MRIFVCARLAESTDSEDFFSYINLHTSNALWKVPPYIPHEIKRNYMNFPEASGVITFILQ